MSSPCFVPHCCQGSAAPFGFDALSRRLKGVQTLAFAAAESSALGIGDVFAVVGSAVADDLRELGHDVSAVGVDD